MKEYAMPQDIPCRFGGHAAATGIYWMPEGCLCWPDPIQALCQQHFISQTGSMNMNRIDIPSRFNGAVLFSHECENNTVKLTLEAAVRSGANLAGAYLVSAYLADANLSGANLDGSDLTRAVLAEAYMVGASLVGSNLTRASLYRANLAGACLDNGSWANAYLSGANLDGATIINRLPSRFMRSDDREFMIFATDGGGTIIKAGCRMLTPDEYRAHVAKEYPDTAKARETLRIIDYLEACAADRQQGA